MKADGNMHITGGSILCVSTGGGGRPGNGDGLRWDVLDCTVDDITFLQRIIAWQ